MSGHRPQRRRSKHAELTALQRSIRKVVIDNPVAKEARDAELAPMAAGDLVQVVQVQLAGKATSKPVWTDATVRWPNPFLCRINKDLSRLGMEDPHFNAGFYCATPHPIIFQAQVKDWVEEDNGFINKARMRFMAWAPDATSKLPFACTVHLTFTGYAAPGEDESEG